METRKTEIIHEVCRLADYDNPEVRNRIAALQRLRKNMRDLNWIGYDRNLDAGFGNLAARIGDEKAVICTATRTSWLPEIGDTHYPIVMGFSDGKVLSKGLDRRVEPTVEVTTHLGIMANRDIGFSLHGHNKIVFDYLAREKSLALVIPKGVGGYGSPEVYDYAKRLAENPKIMKYASGAGGGYGFILHDEPGHPNAFFIVATDEEAASTGLKDIGITSLEGYFKK